MLGNLFLMFVAVGIGVGAVAYGFGGVYLLICGISFAALAWGAAIAITSRDTADDGDVPTTLRTPSRLH